MYGSKIQVTFISPKTKEKVNLTLSAPQDELKAAKLFTKWFGDNRIKQYLSMNNGISESSELEWIKNQNQKKEDLVWMIYVDNIMIGSVGLHRIDFVNQQAELGISITDKKCWGKGIATVVEATVLDYAFNNIVAGGLHKVIIRVFTPNIASFKAAEKVGFRTIGIGTEDIWCNGGWYDVWFGEMLQSEWQTKRESVIEKAGITKLSLYPGCE